MVQGPEVLGSEDLGITLAVLNHNIAVEIENLEYNEDVAGLASGSSSTTTRADDPTWTTTTRA